MQTTLTILGREFAIDCSEADARRLEDLARALDARLAGFPEDADEARRLVLTALSLMDEVQAIGAALVRSRCEIERLTDMLVEAKVEAPQAPVNDERGRVGALRDIPGAA
jgi:cell division protein ZapA (FtsZ GTPase activity inhibitor)